jgi:uncharacterized membrane protein YjjB (DUF3815 family)
MDWYIIITKAFWCGCAATGFGILFNTPTRSLLSIWIGGFTAGLVKYLLLDPAIGSGIILSSFLAGMLAAIVALPLAYLRKVPQILVALPSIIPLVPGIFAYRAMMGLMKLAKQSGSEYPSIISDTVYNGVMAFFVIMAITFGLSVPLILTRIPFIKSHLPKKS